MSVRDATVAELIGSGLFAIAPALGLTDQRDQRRRQLAVSGAAPGTQILGDFGRVAPERVASFAKSVAARLREGAAATLAEGDADAKVARIAAIVLEAAPADAVAKEAVQRIDAANNHRDAIGQEARRLATAVLTAAGGAPALRERGDDPLGLIALTDILFAALLAELPFLRDARGLFAAALAGEPHVPELPRAFETELSTSIAARKAAGAPWPEAAIRRYCAGRLQELRWALESFARLCPDDAPAIRERLGDLDRGSAGAIGKTMIAVEGRYLRAITADLSTGADNAARAAAARGVRVHERACVADFDHAIRHADAAMRILRGMDPLVRWPHVQTLARILRDAAMFEADPQQRAAVMARAAALIDTAVADLPESADISRAQAAMILAEITLSERSVVDPQAHWPTVLNLAESASETFAAYDLIHQALAADHARATAHRLAGTALDDAAQLAKAGALYRTLSERLAAAADAPASGDTAFDAPALSLLARRNDCQRGHWCVLAHLSCLDDDDSAFDRLSEAVCPPDWSPAPEAFCLVADTTAAAARAVGVQALTNTHETDRDVIQGAIDQVMAATEALADPGWRIEQGLLEDLHGTLILQQAADQDDPTMAMALALDAKKRAHSALSTIGHPIAAGLQSDIEALSVRPVDAEATRAGGDGDHNAPRDHAGGSA